MDNDHCEKVNKLESAGKTYYGSVAKFQNEQY